MTISQFLAIIVAIAIFIKWEGTGTMDSLSEKYMTSAEAARFLGVHVDTVSRLAREGRMSAEMVARRWLIERQFVEAMAQSYQPRRGRPRKKRKYTRR